MKVGFHGQESLSEIVARKVEEEARAGRIFWGYGGSLCHPAKQVLPFVKRVLSSGTAVRLVMPTTVSKCEIAPTESREFSEDGLVWQPLPKGVSVRACRYALVIRNLRVLEEFVDLSQFSVGIGPNMGKPLSDYIRGRVDKACAYPCQCEARVATPVRVGLVADLVAPFAVFLR